VGRGRYERALTGNWMVVPEHKRDSA
jgi:hypothetical protein